MFEKLKAFFVTLCTLLFSKLNIVRVHGGWLVSGRFIPKWQAVAKISGPRFFMNASQVVDEIIGAVVLVFVAIVLDVYVIGNQYLFNTTAPAAPEIAAHVGNQGYAITSIVVPIMQVVILVVSVLAAVLVLPKALKEGTPK